MYYSLIFVVILVAVQNSAEWASEPHENQKPPEGGATEFRLTKLLNVELEGEVEKLHTDLQRTLLSEVKGGFEANRCDPKVSTEPQEEVVTILKQLRDEISTLKQNLSDIAGYAASECLVEGDILEGKSFPVGASYHRVCRPGSLGKDTTGTKKYLPRSCKEIQEKGNNVSGMYQIQSKKAETPIMVLCDMETRGGGWTHIQKRYDASVDFYLDWREYKFGFGDLGGEFWLGLENIYKLTGFEVNELLIELVDRENKTAYAHYKAFGIGPESEGYPLNTLRDFSGNGGAHDALKPHLGMKFTTKDFDRDSHPENCAVICHGAWWYGSCHASNLNGKYLNAILPESYKFHSMFWGGLGDYKYCLAKSRMMVRPIG